MYDTRRKFSDNMGVKAMFLDVHAHVYRYQYPTPNGVELFISPAQLKETYERIGVDCAVLLPIVSSEEYMPQSVGEIIDIANESGGKWIPFCNIDPRVYYNNSDSPIGMLLEHYRKLGCRGIGEVMPNLPWRDPRFQNLLHHVEISGFPLIFDMTGRLNSGYGIYDDPGMPQLEYSIARHPGLTFVGHGPAFWAEIGTLRDPSDRHSYPKYGIDKEGRVAELLRTYPNLWVELSAGSGYNAMTRDLDYAVQFLNEFQDRVMFGTDICYYGQEIKIGELLITLRDEKKLSCETFEKIAHGNAERLLKL